MNELLHHAFEEANRQAARLPGEPAAVLVFVFSEDGTAAPVLACAEDALPTVAGRLMEVAGAMLRELTGNCCHEASGLHPEPALIEAEQIAARAIRRAAKKLTGC